MIKLKIGCEYITNEGGVVEIIRSLDNGFQASNGYWYDIYGSVFGFESEDEPLKIVGVVRECKTAKNTAQMTKHKNTVYFSHSDIQLMRNTLVSRLNKLEFFIWENEDWSKRLYRQATPESADGIAAFHKLNKCKDSIRYYKKERKHVAELLRKLKKQQADILRNNAKG